jgi:hypothetical protein
MMEYRDSSNLRHPIDGVEYKKATIDIKFSVDRQIQFCFIVIWYTRENLGVIVW